MNKEEVIELVETKADVILTDEEMVVIFDEGKNRKTDEQIKEKEEKTNNNKSSTNLIQLYSELGMEFLLDKDTLDITARVGSYEAPVSKAKMDEIKKQLASGKKLTLKLKKLPSANDGRQMGDRVFLYGPTGTGKTHSVLTWLEEQKMKYQMVAVSDGFEDIDFLTYIFPSATGIQYKEKQIVSLLREASKGEKVGILIDEANRGSKSFLNFLLKAIDPVTDCYEINNFVADEIIKIPKENIIWFCTANLGGGYSGANDLDEALLDRFNKVSFVGYNEVFEKELYKAFGDYDKDVKTIVEYIRQLFTNNELKRPISSRSLKIRAEDFVNTKKDKGDVFASFERTVMYRLVSVDGFGFPSKETEGIILSKFISLGFISKK